MVDSSHVIDYRKNHLTSAYFIKMNGLEEECEQHL